MVSVFIVDPKRPTRAIKEVEAEIITRKFSWADVNGKRYLIGTSAFFSLAAAKRAKLGYLMKVVEGPGRSYVAWHFPEFYAEAKKQVKNWNKND